MPSPDPISTLDVEAVRREINALIRLAVAEHCGGTGEGWIECADAMPPDCRQNARHLPRYFVELANGKLFLATYARLGGSAPVWRIDTAEPYWQMPDPKDVVRWRRVPKWLGMRKEGD